MSALNIPRKQIDLEADFATLTSAQIIALGMKFIGAGITADSDGRATAEEIIKAGANLAANVNFNSGTIDGLALVTSNSLLGKFLCTYDLTEVTISGGTISPSQTFHSVDTESDASLDYLDTITAPSDANQSQIMYLRGENSARTVIIRDNVGNIRTNGGQDITLSSTTDFVLAIWDNTANVWLLNSQGVAPQQFEKTYRLSDIDLTATGYTTLPLRTDRTFLVNAVHFWHKNINNWTVAPSGTVQAGYCNASDPAGTATDWYDSFSATLGAATSSQDLTSDDTITRVSTGFDSVYVFVDTARTATELDADVFITGLEFTV